MTIRMMPNTHVHNRLHYATSLQKAKADGLVQTGDYNGLRSFIEQACSHDTQGYDSKEVLRHLGQKLYENKPPLDGDNESKRQNYQEILNYFLECIQPRQPLFIHAEYHVRQALFEHYSESGEPRRAADTLAALQNHMKELSVPDGEKAKVYINAAQHYLVDEDDFSADVVIRHAKESGLMEVNDWLIQMQFKVLFARILDSRREYAQAAMWYLIISQSTHTDIPEDEIQEILRSGIVCAILSPPGSNRSRLIGAFYRDSRTHALAEFKMMQRLHLNQFVGPDEVEQFSKGLDERKLAIGTDGMHDVERAMRLHNLSAATVMYRNITFSSLGKLLGISAEAAEDLAAKMISEGRIHATIDQVDGVLDFIDEKDAISSVNDSIRDTCWQLNNLADKAATALYG
eukprot:gb/GECG01000410.1/.p1 GENE.gb/GECG01000410.1/~~gb/GECG01000410.1/.p1  ORF type:complete len:402 (+),score=53.82 gb/GECG01000410.1/:1-1206(+)